MTFAAFARATLLLAVASAVVACGQNNQYAAPPPPRVTVAAPVEQNVTRYFEATGNTAAVNTVDLVARVQGFVQEISYTDGAFVKQGAPLFTIEPQPYELKLTAAQAAESGAQATLKQAEVDYQRQADLARRQVAAQATLDQATATRDNARASLQQAQSNTKQAAINLGYTRVTAPFDGVVAARQVSIGGLVGAGTAPTVLATIVQIDPIWVNFTASERDVLQARANLARRGETTASLLGLPVEVGLQTESGYPHQGKLDYIAPTVNPSTGTLAVRATLPNSDHALLPGLFARIRIPSQPRPALLVPNVALGSDQGGRYVLVVNKDSEVEQRQVEPGQLVGDLRVIESGLSKDDRVVVGGITRAIPGEKVNAQVVTASAAN
ncbi:MAG TPA: efflux RND transporter periplasmic adaptor subunit [Xanthobacteraceae bacterium]|jgi:RND family efflux transporter MFP subunit